ncbi:MULTISPECIES: plasmid replication protein RepC [Agrobacterium]|uniref:Replication initiation protein RepC n=1 Tax=Agrobacterium tumefaciens TaxID=358 RepID=A0AAE6EIK2_AGRTU|nr:MULTISPECIES: plasmid replication protein RepC [Agrobacterium]QCL77240.1 replication initiation protein RepC [Agrobacterium tumefaciens]QCL82745.1 replication initiation protein RepC [Agrobacterium tumefaciens]WCK05863.1 plasmid replication protein RepC [Agrobacterium tumefaciens]CUX72119.1 putative replication protein C [Agrobacterium sp. NCPPB 925]
MQTGHVTTPFGRRPMSLALVKGQMAIEDPRPGTQIEKWRVFRDVCETRERLGLQDRALAVLDALLTFYPHGELDASRGLVVFPSNAQLSVRAHGITESTLRRQLAALVEAGLILRRDSPNGKRYAHRNRDGEVEQAYGFDLTPLLARAKELAQIAQDVAAERLRFRRAKEALTICRRDVRKLISAAVEEGASGNWVQVEAAYFSIIGTLPRHPDRVQLELALDEMQLLREEVLNILEVQLKSENMHGNADQDDRHIQNSNTESINELEPRSEREQGESLADEPQPTSKPEGPKAVAELKKAFPIGMVRRACPQIDDYGPGGRIENWRELMKAAVVVRSMLGVSPSAYEEACSAMGPENAAVAMACILERSSFITSAGGYLRNLTRRAERGEFSLGPMLMALMKANGGERRIA